MTAIAGTVAYWTVVTVTAASGDGAAIAAKFSGVDIPGVSTTTAAVATNASGVVTITWPQTVVRCSNEQAQTIIANILAADTTLTSPITVGVVTMAELI